jgi:hypothetical protein
MPSTQAPRRRHPARGVATLAAAAALLLVAAVPAAAKEFLVAHLEVPISFDSPAGAQLLVSVVLLVPDDPVDHPVDGSPVWLRLTGPNGDLTEAPGRSTSVPGRYEMRITVPPGGPRHLQLVLRGADELPIMLSEDPFTFRPVGPGTAQVVVPAAVVATPAPAAVAPAAPPAPAATPAPVASPIPAEGAMPWGMPLAIAALAAAALVILLAALGWRWRARRAARTARVDGIPGS